MPRLPVLSGQEMVRILAKAGFEVRHQKGSHIILRKVIAPCLTVSVPNHVEIKRGLLRGLIREAGLTRDEFLALLD